MLIRDLLFFRYLFFSKILGNNFIQVQKTTQQISCAGPPPCAHSHSPCPPRDNPSCPLLRGHDIEVLFPHQCPYPPVHARYSPAGALFFHRLQRKGANIPLFLPAKNVDLCSIGANRGAHSTPVISPNHPNPKSIPQFS